MIEDSTAMEAQLHNKDIVLKAQVKALQAKSQEILALKAMDPSERSKLEVEKANQRITTVFAALGAIGQEICKPRRVSTTLNLVGGNITVAMLQYGVNITNLEEQSFQTLLRNGNRTTKEFLIFMTLSQKIALNDWSLLTKQPVFLMVGNLRVWCTLLDYSSDYEEDEDEIFDMEPVPEELPTFATHQEQYKKNWKIMANIRKGIIVI